MVDGTVNPKDCNSHDYILLERGIAICSVCGQEESKEERAKKGRIRQRI